MGQSSSRQERGLSDVEEKLINPAEGTDNDVEKQTPAQSDKPPAETEHSSVSRLIKLGKDTTMSPSWKQLLILHFSHSASGGLHVIPRYDRACRQ